MHPWLSLFILKFFFVSFKERGKDYLCRCELDCKLQLVGTYPSKKVPVGSTAQSPVYIPPLSRFRAGIPCGRHLHARDHCNSRSLLLFFLLLFSVTVLEVVQKTSVFDFGFISVRIEGKLGEMDRGFLGFL
jgi:hypothetical protein